MSSLFVKLFLVEIVLLFQLLRHLPNHIILELEEFALFLVMLQQHLSFSKLPGQVVRVDIDVDFKLLGHRVLDVLVQLTIAVQEADTVRALLLWSNSLSLSLWRRRFLTLSIRLWGQWCRLSLIFSGRNLFHKHKDLVDSRDVLLHFSNIMLKHSRLNALSASEALHDGSVFVPNVTVDDSLDELDLLKTLVQSNDLINQLSPLGHQALVDV